MGSRVRLPVLTAQRATKEMCVAGEYVIYGLRKLKYITTGPSEAISNPLPLREIY